MAEYSMRIDFAKLAKDMRKAGKHIKGDPLEDIDYSQDSLDFFTDLLNAKTTQDLAKYSPKDLIEAERHIETSNTLLQIIKGMCDDQSILRDVSELSKKMGNLHLHRRRRLL